MSAVLHVCLLEEGREECEKQTGGLPGKRLKIGTESESQKDAGTNSR